MGCHGPQVFGNMPSDIGQSPSEHSDSDNLGSAI
jgi:hypothetical protein